MTRLAEISADAVAGVRTDVASTRCSIQDGLGPLRWRASGLGVDVSGFDDALCVADRLGTSVLPVLDTHLARARDLEDLRYGGLSGALFPVVDDDPDPFAPPFSAFTQQVCTQGTVLSWAAASPQEQAADTAATGDSAGISSWFSDRWDEVSDAVQDGTDWVASSASDAWEQVTDAGAAIGDWWERTTADVGGWIDANLDGLRDFIGRHVGLFRFLASACRVVGWVLVAVGAVLTVALAIIGAMGGSALGAVFGFGVGAVPGGGAGAVAGASYGLKIVGAGFTLVSVGDFLDVAADWGEGTIDGQDLVKKGTLELSLALASWVGAGVLGKVLQKSLTHLPASVRTKLDEFLASRIPRTGPLDEAGMSAPLHSGSRQGNGWVRGNDVEPDLHYGEPRSSHAPLNTKNAVPSTIDPDIELLGGDLSDPWGVNPDTGAPFSEAEWTERFVDGNGDIRWPPNRGAVPGTRIEFTDADRFVEIYGSQFDRIGDDGGGFLGVPPGASFDQRALPPVTLDESLNHYTFTGVLPPGVTIEVSEIAPAFGRQGGGIQARFLENGRAMRVLDLIGDGILE